METTETNLADNFKAGYMRAGQYLSNLWVTRRRPILITSFVSTLLFITIAVIEVVSTYSHYAAIIDVRLADQAFFQSPGIYAAPRRLNVGQRITEEQLKERLLRAGYLADEQSDRFSAGNFISNSGQVVIHRTRFVNSVGLSSSVRIRFGRNGIEGIEDYETGKGIKSILLAPEMLTADINVKKQTRLATGFDELPPVLINALCAIEDRRFFSHSGLDPRGIVRALFRNLRHGEIREGGSTITQQLVKNQFLAPARTWERKIAEAFMAVALERRLTKQQILALYCDRVYLGQNGLTAIYGFKQAAHVYFKKELSALSAAEAAFLSGLAKAPNRYRSSASLDDAIERRNIVLDAMVEAGYISREEATAGKSEVLTPLQPENLDASAAPHFVDYVKRELDKQSGEFDWTQTYVETTLDLDLQEAATQAVAGNLARISKASGRLKKANRVAGRAQPEAALIALDPQSGEILAMVGGRDYAASQLNRATDAHRQPGSLFKPIVYAAALSRGISPAATFINAPREIVFAHNAVYRPQNYGRSYSQQPVTLRESLVRSLNVVAVDAAMQTGLGNVAEMAERMGLPRPENYPSMALGAFEATPLELARAYTVFANQGMRVDPLAIRSIRLGGEPVTGNRSVKATVLSPAMAYLITDALSDVVNRGTAAGIRRQGYRGPAAGKTGTSRDAWFIGYTPKLLVVVWAGYDDHSDLRLLGGQAAVPIWADFVKRALELRPDLAAREFARPAGLAEVMICTETGAEANEYCPHRQPFLLTGHLIPGFCYKHQAPVIEMEEMMPEIEAASVELPFEVEDFIPVAGPPPPSPPR